MTLRIVQLSDCHLSADPSLPYRGQDADANLEKVWQEARAWKPDLVLLTGDLSEDGSDESYRRLKQVVNLSVPVLALPGNHDKPDIMQAYFSAGPWNGPFAFESGGWLIVCLDSKLTGRIEGGISEESLSSLRESLSDSDQEHVLLALHHQPVRVGAPWIDRYALTDPGAFMNIVEADSRVRCVVWGHIHHHFAEQRAGKWFLGAPSTAANSLARSDRFEPDPRGPACRTLELGDCGDVVFDQLFGNSG